LASSIPSKEIPEGRITVEVEATLTLIQKFNHGMEKVASL